MRRFIFFLGLVALSVCAADSPVHAEEAVAPAQQTSPIHIAAHRAIYTMSMASAKSGSNITDASGRLQFEWRDVCDGWAIQQHMKLHLA